MIKRISGSFVGWCVSVANSDDYVILDSETTGLKSHDQIVELAIMAASGQILYDKLLKPSCPIDKGAMNAHKITEAMVADARSFAEEWQEIEAAIAGRYIITYNAAFDARMPQQTAMANKITLKDIDYYCLMTEYAAFWDAPARQGVWLGSQRITNGNAPYQKLQEACRQQGVRFSQEHRALGDTLATLALIRSIAEKGEKAPTYHTRQKDWWE